MNLVLFLDYIQMSQANREMNKKNKEYVQITHEPHEDLSSNSQRNAIINTQNNNENEITEDNYLDHQNNAGFSMSANNLRNKIFIGLLTVAVILMLLTIAKQHSRFKLIVSKIQGNKQNQSQTPTQMQSLKVLKSEFPLRNEKMVISTVKQVQNTIVQSVQPKEIQQQIKVSSSEQRTKSKKKMLVLQRTEKQLQEIIKRMQNPTYRRPIRNVQKSTRLQDEVYFAFQLSRQPYNEQYLEAEYHYYNKRYNLSVPTQELPICAVMVGRNLGDNYDKMISSILRQNYSNYHIVFVDDSSNDKTKQNLQSYISSNKELNQRTTLLWQQEREYALYNRNKAMRNHCKKGDIVLDLDADDWLIGNQVFKIVNSLYQNQSIWACYFNNIIYYSSCKCPLMNIDSEIPMSILENNSYRTSNLWRTTQLRTFRKNLYDKIQQKEFIDQTGKFYKYKSDSFINYAIVELAAPKHIKFLDQFLYYYDTSFTQTKPEKAFCRLTSKAITPYKPLRSLDEPATKVENYEPPQNIVNQLMKIKKMRGSF